jgi:hypothetical protein
MGDLTTNQSNAEKMRSPSTRARNEQIEDGTGV